MSSGERKIDFPLDLQSVDFALMKRLALPCLQLCHKYVGEACPTGAARTAFRSSDLRSAAEAVFPKSCHTKFSNAVVTKFGRFVDKRTFRCPHVDVDANLVCEEALRSKAFLVTDWTSSLFDGATSSETCGFIDENGMPPWDTWLALMKIRDAHGEVCLLSWVPRSLAGRVDVAIQIDAAESLSWLRIEIGGSAKIIGWGKPWPD